MPNLLQIAAKKLANKSDKTENHKDSELEMAMQEFNDAKTVADKAQALKAFMSLVSDD